MAYNPFIRTAFDDLYGSAASARTAAATGSGLLPSSYYYLSGRPMNPSIVNTPVSGGTPNSTYSPVSAFAGPVGTPATTAGGQPVDTGKYGPANDARNPFYPISLIKEPGARATAEDQLKFLDTTSAENAKTLDQYIKEFSAMIPQNRTQLATDQSVLGDITGANGLRSRVYGALDSYDTAAKNLADWTVRNARATAPTGMGIGTNYLKGVMDQVSNAGAKMAQDVAMQRLNAEPMLSNLALATVGKGQSLNSAYLQNLLAPIVASQSMLQGNAANLASILKNLGGTTDYYIGRPSNVLPTTSISSGPAIRSGSDALTQAIQSLMYGGQGFQDATQLPMQPQFTAEQLAEQARLFGGGMTGARTPTMTYDINGNPSTSPYFRPDQVMTSDLNSGLNSMSSSMNLWNLLNNPSTNLTFNPYGESMPSRTAMIRSGYPSFDVLTGASLPLTGNNNGYNPYTATGYDYFTPPY